MMMVDTGDPRSVTGHIVSGAIASATVAGGINYSQYKKGQVTKQEAVKNTVKLSAQGGVATGAAIAAANYLGNGSVFGMLSAMSVGIAGVYAIEKVSEAYDEKVLAIKNEENEKIEKEEVDG